MNTENHAALAATFPNGNCQCEQCKPFNDALPADKWAAEKAALADGKAIEWRYLKPNRINWCDWKACPSPIWITDGAAEYRIAPGPAPAGKLSDEQLGEIGKAAAKCTVHWSQINTAFAAAVREAVGKEQAEEIARLTAELSTVNAERAETRVIRSEMIKAQAELAKANAELERLRPRPMRTPPTASDINSDGRVLLLGDGNSTHLSTITDWNDIHESWRRWLPLNLAAYDIQTSEEVSRVEFEKACAQYGLSFIRDEGGNYRDSRTLVLFDVWQAARAAKEGEK